LFYVLIALDKSASIDFVRPGRSRVSAVFEISDEEIREIREHTADGGKNLARFTVRIKDGQGDLVAQAKKVLYIRRKTE
jgi:acyl-coenzyme A thioesterase PaaI-like protein